MAGWITFDRASQCDGKQRFANGSLAWRVAKRRAEHDKPSVVYRCQHCGGWHLGRRLRSIWDDED